MMMRSNSKPRAAGTSPSQPDGGVYLHCASPFRRHVSCVRRGAFLHEQNASTPVKRDTKVPYQRLLFLLRGMLAIQNT
jgi:hypothetical protein